MQTFKSRWIKTEHSQACVALTEAESGVVAVGQVDGQDGLGEVPDLRELLKDRFEFLSLAGIKVRNLPDVNVQSVYCSQYL